MRHYTSSIQGGFVVEDSGGIALETANDEEVQWAESSPYFQFDFDSVQLCNISQVAGPSGNINTAGDYWLDNTYPYGNDPFSDEPHFDFAVIYFTECYINDYYQWSGVCKPHDSYDYIWATGASMDWSWIQSEGGPPWGNPTGGLTPGSVFDVWFQPYEWSNVFVNPTH